MRRITIIICLLLCTVGAFCAGVDTTLNGVLGRDAQGRWEISSSTAAQPYSLQADLLLGRPALVCGDTPLTLTSRAGFRNAEIACLVRLVTDPKHTATSFTLTMKELAKPDISIALTGSYNGNLNINAAGITQNYDLRAYDVIQPTWPDAVRLPLENDMSNLPLSQDKWVRIRCRLTDDCLRIWVDDRLLVEKTKDVPLSVIAQVTLQPESRLANLAVIPLAAQPSLYEPINLDGYARDRALFGGAAVADSALPFGDTVTEGGIPFRFVERITKSDPDHLDVSRSLLRLGAMSGYLNPTTPRFSGSFTVDPARFQLRVPNARYDAMYVIAGFDGGTDRVPILSAMFYRPNAGYAQCFEGKVPLVTARSAGDAQPLLVTLENGAKVNLWVVKIPLDPAKLASFSDMDLLEVELTKQVRQYRYGWHGAGLPSGVHVYAVTLHRPAVEFSLQPTVFGHVWTDPDIPGYTVALSNNTPRDRTVKVSLRTTSYDKGERHAQQQTFIIPAGKQWRQTFTFTVKKNGIHQLDATLTVDGQTWTETRDFCRLAPDTRAPVWQEGQGPFFGYWSYHSGHYGPPMLDVMRVMKMAGARGTAMGTTDPNTPEGRWTLDNHWLTGPNAWPITAQRDWAGADPVDPARYEGYKATAIEAIRKAQGDNPPLITFFPEPNISQNLTGLGAPSDYWGENYTPTADEKTSLRVFMNTAKSAAEAVRNTWPKSTILIPWGETLFAVPLLRAGFPKELIDGSGLDMPTFERLPEMQLARLTTHLLYVLKNEYKNAGIPDPRLYYVEGTFVPTQTGTLTWEEQAERYHRWALISLAYGVQRFYSGWFAYDCGDYYGAENYGGCGIQRRIPYLDPKPAYAHYATMTRMLERSKFEKWLPTGSTTAYCLKFTRPSWTQPGQTETVYALWTVRGTQPVTLTLAKDATITVTDSMDNGTPLPARNGKANFTIGESPIYVTGASDITAVTLGKPDNSTAVTWSRNRNQETWLDGPAVTRPPVTKTLTLANFGDGAWKLAAERDTVYENNTSDTRRFLGNMSAAVTTDPERKGRFLAIHLEQQDRENKFMSWYTVLNPAKPIEIPGKACALGVWVKAHSDWGRVVYCLQDAKGERWISTSNVAGYTAFCFDGWRYLRFDLPSHAEYDSFREFGAALWSNYRGDGIVDLPLKLEKVMVERRTHVMYVNDPQPADPRDVLLGELIAEYETPFDATPAAVALNRARMPLPPAGSNLPNPIAAMTRDNTLPALTLLDVSLTDPGSCIVTCTETPEATDYQAWLSAYPDGRGAVQMANGPKPTLLLRRLPTARKFYLWVTCTTKDGKTSKPSDMREIQLPDPYANQ